MWLKVLGLGIIQCWLWLFFLNGPLLYNVAAKYGSSPETVFVTFLLFNSISYLLVAKMGQRLSPLGKKPLLLILCMSLMTTGTIVAGLVTKDFYIFSKDLLIILGTLGSGFGSAILISAWGEQYSTLPAHRTSLAFGMAVTVGTVIFYIINRLPLPTAVLITAFIPLLSGSLLLYKVDEPEIAAPIQRSLSFPFPTQFVILVILFYLASGLMHKLLASGLQLGFYENFWLTNIVYFAVCLLAGGIVYFHPGLDLRFLYRPILPLLGIGFVLFPVLQRSNAVIPFTFLQAGFALFDLYTWVLFCYLAARHRFPASVIAWGMCLITSAILTGELLFTGIFSTIAVTMKQTDLISLFAAILLFAGTLVFRDEPETFAGWDSPSDPTSDLDETIGSSLTFEEMACTTPVIDQVIEECLPAERFTAMYNLTPREMQVLLLLLEGRNNPYIREKFNVSNNTLKTHLRNIYRKLSINDRQELVDLYKKFNDNFSKET